MLPVPIEDFEPVPTARSLKQALGDLALSALVVSAVVLIVSFTTATAAHAQ
jgi:hypothetical protein